MNNPFYTAQRKLTLVYFTIISIIVVIFSLIVFRLQDAQLTSFRNVQETIRNFRPAYPEYVGPEFRQELEQRSRERANEIQQTIDQARATFVSRLIFFDLIILGISFVISSYLSKETLKPILTALEKQKQFIADASHELKTPITSMKTEIDVVLRSPSSSPEDYKETLISAQEELSTLTSLTAHLLDIARAEDSTNQVIILDDVHLDLLLTHEVTKYQKIAHKDNIKFFLEAPISTIVKGNEQRLRQLIRILLDNAVKYNKKEGSIFVKLYKIDKQVAFIIEDTGIGIPKKHIGNVFNRFYRASFSRTKKGFGLGLSIADQIVR